MTSSHACTLLVTPIERHFVALVLFEDQYSFPTVDKASMRLGGFMKSSELDNLFSSESPGQQNKKYTR